MAKFRYIGNHTYQATQSGFIVANANVHDEGNFVRSLYVKPQMRRKGIATELVRFICEHRGRKLNRAPSRIKNDAVKALSAKMGDELEVEAK